MKIYINGIEDGGSHREIADYEDEILIGDSSNACRVYNIHRAAYKNFFEGKPPPTSVWLKTLVTKAGRGYSGGHQRYDAYPAIAIDKADMWREKYFYGHFTGGGETTISYKIERVEF